MNIETAVREALEEVGEVYYHSDVEETVKLVVEKFTSTNSAMVPCPKYHRGGKCNANPWRTLCGSEHCMVPARHQ